MSDAFMSNLRKISGRVKMSFYESSEDNDADISLEGGVLTGNDWRALLKNQILSSGLVPKYKYAALTAAGLTRPDGTAYLVNFDDRPVFPLWSETCADSTGAFSGNEVVYRLDFTAPRSINKVLVVGDEKWQQGPVSYDVRIYVPEELNAQTSDNVYESFGTVTQGYTIHNFIGSASVTWAKVSISSKTYYRYIYSLTNVTSGVVKQMLILKSRYQAVAMELAIKKWNAAGTPAKIMLIANDINITCEADEIQSLKILEEKADDAQELSYGITSNSCTVKVKNTGNRFINNRDMLKKSRIVKPFLLIDDADGAAPPDPYPMGTFFSDDWEISSASSFVTCKAYDVLYSLQKLYVYYEMTASGGSYYVDGTTYGFNATAKAVLEKIFRLINLQRKINGIFGKDIEAEIDPTLSSVSFNYVCLGYDTAWNLLNTVAHAAQCFIFVTREGKVKVLRDKLPASASAQTPVVTVPAGAPAISAHNSFSCNLPTMSKAVVNRVKVPYFTLEGVGSDEKEEQFTIEAKDCVKEANGDLMITLNLKKFYSRITKVERCSNNSFTPMTFAFKAIYYTFDKIYINMGNMSPATFYFKLSYLGSKFDLKENTYVYNRADSQKSNGVVECELKSGKLLYGENPARDVGGRIANKYQSGKAYIEASWIGTPELKLDGYFKGSTREDPAQKDYECFSNEFSLGNGLRVTTKGREV